MKFDYPEQKPVPRPTVTVDAEEYERIVRERNDLLMAIADIRLALVRLRRD